MVLFCKFALFFVFFCAKMCVSASIRNNCEHFCVFCAKLYKFGLLCMGFEENAKGLLVLSLFVREGAIACI